MTVLAFDCAVPVSDRIIQRAVEKGFGAIGRYLGTPGSSKLLLPSEARRISASGLSIFCYFERTAARPLLGRSAGEADGALARSQAAAVGQPKGSGICFAVDRDVSFSSLSGPVREYFEGVRASLEGTFRVGVYGSGVVCKFLANLGLADYEILAGAMGWTGSRDYRAWEGLQHPPTLLFGSLDADPVELDSLEGVGAWQVGGASVPSVADPEPSMAAAIISDIRALQKKMKDAGYYLGEVDGIGGSLTTSAMLRAFRAARGRS